MSSHVKDAEEIDRRQQIIAEYLGLDLTQINRSHGFTAESSNGGPVTITWTGVKVLSQEEWNTLYGDLLREASNG